MACVRILTLSNIGVRQLLLSERKHFRHKLFVPASYWTNNQIRTVVMGPKLCAGHAHWQNVLSTKTKKDKQKANQGNLVMRKIAIAIRGYYQCLCDAKFLL